MFPLRSWLGLLFAPALLFAQPIAPPPQEYVLHFQPDAVASTDQIQLGAAFTMESWVLLDAPTQSGGGVIMGKTAPSLHYMIGVDGRKPFLAQTIGLPGTYRAAIGTADLPLNSWVHVAGVLDSGTLKLYVNGQLVASAQSAGIPGGAAVPFDLGGAVQAKSPGCGNLCNPLCCSLSGALREARVWSRALSVSELKTFAAQTLTGNELGLIADWPLSERTGQIVHGVGPQPINLTIQGAPIWASTQLLDNGPYWEAQAVPSLTDMNYGIQAAVYRNANGLPDLLLAYTPYDLAQPTTGPVLFLHNQGNRNFTPVKPTAPVGTVWPRNSTVADFNHDGLEDVVMADTGYDAPPYPGGVTRIFMQRSSGMVDETSSRLPPLTAFTHDVCSGDVNRDGSPDLFFGSQVLYLNDGKGNFKTATELLPLSLRGGPKGVLSCQFVDVNRDGAAELVLGLNERPSIFLLNDGTGTFRDTSAQALPPSRGGPNWATHGFTPIDMNRDGWPDLIVSLAESGSLANADARGGFRTTMQLLINNHDGTFRDQSDAGLNVIRTEGWFDKIYAIDLNRDGLPDLVVEEGRFGVRLYQNMGDHFADRTETLSAGSSRPRAADFDGDGRVDIALFNENRIKIAWGKNLWPPVATITPVVTSVNMAGGFPGIVQNGWIEIKGTNLTPPNVGSSGMTWETAREFATGGMPAHLAGISVTVNGKPSFVYYVSPTQLNILSPLDSTLGTVRIVVTSGGLSSLPFNAEMRAAAPSFPLFGANYVVATHTDYTLVGPTSLSAPGFPVTPAGPGETIVLYGFGFGLPVTALMNGASSQSGVLPALPAIRIGGAPAAVSFAGVVRPGLYQFNVIVPSTTPDGDNLVSVSYNGSNAPSGSLITIKRLF